VKIKHSKYKNTGILFELLVRQITADTLKGVDSPSINILKKYFVKSELGREYKLYESILKSKVLDKTKANIFIDTLIENCTKFNRGSLKKAKYNLISEIKNHYNLDEFFGSKIINYKALASVYTLIESYNNIEFSNIDQINTNKITLLEHLTKEEVKEEQKDEILKEFSSYDKDVKTLTYKIILEKFNEKYDSLTIEQKQILKEFINSVDSTPSLRNFYNSKVIELKEILKKESKEVDDKVMEIKIKEVTKLLTELGKNDKVSNDNLVDLLQYYELIKEIRNINEKV
jgi:hypothetical protein